jgi:DNA (cytosine-5)-methyltransferase 1
MTNKPRAVVSLFSGAGGFDWGFHEAGFKTHLAVELKKYPAQTIAHNLELKTLRTPATPAPDELPIVIQGDVHDVDFSRLTSLQPDVLIGGPPCQDFSLSKGGKREGLNGGRGKLYLEFLRALMFLQPKMFVFENVPGFTSANEGLAYDTVLDDLRNLDAHRKQALLGARQLAIPHEPVSGYDILFRGIVDGPAVGVPQTRRRLIIVGIRSNLAALSNNSETQPKQSVADALTGKQWYFSRYPLTPIEVFEGQPLDKLRDKYRQVMQDYRSLAEDPPFERAQEWRRRVWDKLTFDIVHDYYTANGLDYARDHNTEDFKKAMRQHKDLLRDLGWLGKPVYSISEPANERPQQSAEVQQRMFYIPPEENAAFVDGTKWQVENKRISFIYRRPSPLKPAWTVMAYGGGGTYGYHYERDRQMLTLRERARIQTFSDAFEFRGRDIRAQIGEAVPPLLGKRIADVVTYILDEVEARENSTDDGSYSVQSAHSVR